MKKLLASLLVVCMLFSVVTLSGCSKKDKDKETKTKADSTKTD